ncbi:MAG: extracellular solute-binding protein [Lachnospiraceae bacterium]|jgi:maltose-binding protein MalE|nr:extracellular solute-binding protein [Lachnospiraceae bacterium]
MKILKRIIAAIIIVGLAAVIICLGISEEHRLSALQASLDEEEVYITRETIRIWYTDEDLNEYINSAAVAFASLPENSHIRVTPVLVSALEYLENINFASINGEGPDLYIIGHDNLEKAYLAGLATVVDADTLTPLIPQYPDIAISAVSYHGKILAFPFYFETTALIYNRSHLEEMARAKIISDADFAAAEQAMLDLETHGPEDEILEATDHLTDIEALLNDDEFIESRLSYLRPASFEDLKDIAMEYDAPLTVEALLEWDVTDIFYNYFFIGDTITVGGESGDNTANINIYNRSAFNSLRMYQELNQFFAIEAGKTNYRDIVEKFINGKLVYTIATTDIVAALDEAARAEIFTDGFGVLPTLHIDDTTHTRSLSMVGSVVINGYTDQKAEANRFASFLVGEYAGNLYAYTGKIPANHSVIPDDPRLLVFADEFARSIPLPKMIETSNFWVLLETTFAHVWGGANVNEELRLLSERVMSQITGTLYHETAIEDDIVRFEFDYLDEDELIREAQQ